MKSGSARGLNFLLKQLFAAAGNEQLRTKKGFGMLKEVLRNYLKFCSFSSSEKSTFNRVILNFLKRKGREDKNLGLLIFIPIKLSY